MSRIASHTPGFIYVMSSASLNRSADGGLPILKIGASTNEPDLRAQQLTASTSAPTSFQCVYSRWVNDVTEGEKRVHEMLADRRVNARREFFQCSVLEACMAVDRVAGGQSQIDYGVATPFAELFASFPENDGEGRFLTPAERQQCRDLEARLVTVDGLAYREAA